MAAGGEAGSGARLATKVLVALTVSILLFTACGSGDDPATPDSSPASTPTDEASPTPDPTPTELRADRKTQKLAEAAILRTKDYGPGWKEYSAGAATTLEDREASCSSREGGLPQDIGAGAAQTGATVQFKKAAVFSTSYSYVVPNAKAAKKLIAVINSRGWSDCKKAELEAFQKKQGNDALKIVLDEDKDPSLGQGGFEARIGFLYKEKGRLTGVVDISVYRLERVVILVQNEYGATKQAELNELSDGTYRALTKAYARVNKAL